MNQFSVTVKTANQRISYVAIGSSSADVADAAIDKFGLCAVTVMVQQ